MMHKLSVRRCPHGLSFNRTTRCLHSSVVSCDNNNAQRGNHIAGPLKHRIKVRPIPLPSQPAVPQLNTTGNRDGASFGFKSPSQQEQFMTSLNIKLCDAEIAAKRADWSTFRTKFDAIFSDVEREEKSGRQVSYIDLQKIFTRYCMEYTKASNATMPVTFLHLLIKRSSNQLKDRLLTEILQHMVSGQIPSDAQTLTLIFQRCASHRAVGGETAERALDETLAVLMHLRQTLKTSISVTPVIAKRWISFYSTVGDLPGSLTMAHDLQTHHGIDMDNDIYQLLLYACGRAATKDPTALDNAYHIIQHLISSHNAKERSASDVTYAIESPLLDNLVFGLLTVPFGTPRDLAIPSAEQVNRALSVIDRIKVLHAQLHCPPASVHIFQSIIFARCSAGKVREAYWLYKDMRCEYGYLLDDISFVALCSAIADTTELGINEAASLFIERASVMKHRIGPDILPATFGSFLDICVRFERLDLATLVLKEMSELNIPRDLITYEVLVRLYGKRGDLDRVLTLYHELLQQDLQPGLHFYSTLVLSCGDNLAAIYSILLDLKTARVQPNEELCHRVLVAVRRQEPVASHWLIPLFSAILNASTVSKESLKSDTASLTSSNSQVPQTTAALSSISVPLNSITFPTQYAALAARIWIEYMDAIAKSASQPSDLVAQLTKLMKSHNIPISRALYRDLILGRVSENDVNGMKQLLTFMIHDNTPLDIDLVTSIARTASAKSKSNVLPYRRAIESVVTSKTSGHSDAYSVLFKGLCRAGQTDDAISLLDEMVEKSLTSVQSLHLSDLVSSLSDTEFVHQVTKIYDHFASFGYTPDSSLVLQMAEKCHNSSDVAIVLATKQSYNLDISSLSYEQLLIVCLKQSPVDMPLFNNVIVSMTKDNVKLSSTALDLLFATCKSQKLLDAAHRLWTYATSDGRIQFGWIVACAQTAAKARTQPTSQTFVRTLLASAFKLDDKALQPNWPTLLNAVIQTYNARTRADNAILDILRDCFRHEAQWMRHLAHADVHASLNEALITRLSGTMNDVDWKILSDCIRRLPFSVQNTVFDCIVQLYESNDASKQSLSYAAVLVALKIFSKYSTWPVAIKQKLVVDEHVLRNSMFKLLSIGPIGAAGRITTVLQSNNISFSARDWAELCLQAIGNRNLGLVSDVFTQSSIDWKSAPEDLIQKLLDSIEAVPHVKNKQQIVSVLQTAQKD